MASHPRYPIGEPTDEELGDLLRESGQQTTALERRRTLLQPPQDFGSDPRIVPRQLYNTFLATRHRRITGAIAQSADSRTADYNERLLRVDREIQQSERAEEMRQIGLDEGRRRLRDVDRELESFVPAGRIDRNQLNAVARIIGPAGIKQLDANNMLNVQTINTILLQDALDGEDIGLVNDTLLNLTQPFDAGRPNNTLVGLNEAHARVISRLIEERQSGGLLGQSRRVTREFLRDPLGNPLPQPQGSFDPFAGLALTQEARVNMNASLDYFGGNPDGQAALSRLAAGHDQRFRDGNLLENGVNKALQSFGEAVVFVEDTFREEVLRPYFEAGVWLERVTGQDWLVGDIGEAIARGENPAELPGFSGTLGKAFNAATSPLNWTIAGSGPRLIGLTQNIPVAGRTIAFIAEPFIAGGLLVRGTAEISADFAVQMIAPELPKDLSPILSVAFTVPAALAGVTAFRTILVAPKLTTAAARAVPSLIDDAIIQRPGLLDRLPFTEEAINGATLRSLRRRGGDLISGGSGLYGREAIMVGPDPNFKFTATYRVIEADDLIISNLDDFAVNPDYPAEVQPRDRTRQTERETVEAIKAEFSPDEVLTDYGVLDRGTPIIGPDLVVEGGNGRSIALRHIFADFPELADRYVGRMKEVVEDLGLDPDAIDDFDQPILVRERTSDLDEIGMSRAEFAALTSLPPANILSEIENAALAAGRIRASVLQNLTVSEGGSIDVALLRPENAAIIAEVFSGMPRQERSRYQSTNGVLNTDGIQLIKNALMLRTFDGDSAQRFAQVVAESAEPTAANAMNAVYRALGDMAAVKALVELGARPAAFDISDDIARAVEVLARLRQKGATVREYVHVDADGKVVQPQATMFGSVTTPFQDRLILLMDEFRSAPKQLGEIFSNYARFVRETMPDIRAAGDMFEGLPEGLATIQRQAAAAHGLSVDDVTPMGVLNGAVESVPKQSAIDFEPAPGLADSTPTTLAPSGEELARAAESPGQPVDLPELEARGPAIGERVPDLPEQPAFSGATPARTVEPRGDDLGPDATLDAKLDIATAGFDSGAVVRAARIGPEAKGNIPDDVWELARRVVELEDVNAVRENARGATGDTRTPVNAALQEILGIQPAEGTVRRAGTPTPPPGRSPQPGANLPGQQRLPSTQIGEGLVARPTGDLGPVPPSAPGAGPLPDGQGLSDVTRQAAAAGGVGGGTPPPPAPPRQPQPGPAALPPGGPDADISGQGRLNLSPQSNAGYRAPPAAAELYGVKDVRPGITPVDNIVAMFDQHLFQRMGIGRDINELATPMMRVRRDAQQPIRHQANRLSKQFVAQRVAVWDAVTDVNGRLLGIEEAMNTSGVDPRHPRQPKLSDIAARLPTYREFLTDDQVRSMDWMKENLGKVERLLHETGRFPGSRRDIEPGGFYIPRGFAHELDWDGGGPQVNVRGGRGRATFENGAVFDSQAAGIDAGFVYPEVSEAVSRYLIDAPSRALDSWTAGYFRALENPDGSFLGQSVEQRLLKRDPKLRGAKDAIDNELAFLERVHSGLDDDTRLVIDRFLFESKPDVDLLRDKLLDSKVEGAVGRAAQLEGMTRVDLEGLIDGLRQDLVPINEAFKRARDQAATTPRGQGRIDLNELRGLTFPDEVARSANRFLEAERPLTGRGAAAINGIEAVNFFLRGLRATLDFSFTGVQGLMGFAVDPKGYGEAWTVAIRAYTDGNVAGAWTFDFDRRATRRGRATSEQWTAAGLAQLGEGFELAFRVGDRSGRSLLNPERIPTALGGGLIRASNRGFGTFGDIMRLRLVDDIADAQIKAKKKRGEPTELSKTEMEEIATAANLVTGWSKRRLGGELGNFALFAPRFYQSQLELMVAAFSSKSITGDIARQAMQRLIGGGIVMTVVANELLEQSGLGGGIPLNELFLPTSSNFMRIRIGGADVSLFGPWDSLLRGTVALMQGDPGFILRSKASPIIGMGWDLWSGENFIGEPTTPLTFVRSMAPFSLQDAFDEPLLVTGLGALGIKATPLSPSERRDEALREGQEEGRYPSENLAGEQVNRFRDLDAVDQFKFIEENPDHAEVNRYEERIGEAVEQGRTQFINAALEDYERTRNTSRFKEAVDVAAAVLLRDSQTIAAELGLSGADEDRDDPFRAGIADYYQVFTTTCATPAGGLDGECVGLELSALEDRVPAGVWEFIQANTGTLRKRLGADVPMLGNLERLEDEVFDTDYFDSQELWGMKPDRITNALPPGWPLPGYQDTYRSYRQFVMDSLLESRGLDPSTREAEQVLNQNFIVREMEKAIGFTRREIIKANPRIGAILLVTRGSANIGDFDSQLRLQVDRLVPSIRLELEAGQFRPEQLPVVDGEGQEPAEAPTAAAITPATLTERQQEALRLTEDGGLTQGQAAIQMGTNRDAFKQLLRRARRTRDRGAVLPELVGTT